MSGRLRARPGRDKPLGWLGLSELVWEEELMKMKVCGGVLALAMVVSLLGRPADAAVGRSPRENQALLHVLAIGSNYSSSELSISGAADAEALAGVFKADIGSLYGVVEVVEIVNVRATRTGILLAVNEAAAILEPEDTFVFFFSGHVTNQGGRAYLVPHGALLSDGNQLDTNELLSATDLQLALDRVRAEHRLLLFDSDYIDIGLGTKGAHVFHASGPKGRALQGEKHGYFTAMLLQGLEGRADADQNERVSVLELADFVARHLPAFSSDRQFPAIRLYGPDFPLVVRPKRDSDSAAASLADKLDAVLLNLIRSYEAKGFEGVQAYGDEHRLDLPNGQVLVTFNAASPSVVRHLKRQVARLGGVVETEFANLLYAFLPVAALEQVVMQTAVRRVYLGASDPPSR